METLDPEKYRAQYQNIRARIWQNHLLKANNVSEMAEKAHKEIQKTKAARKEKNTAKWESESVQLSDSVMVVQNRSQPWKAGKRTEGKEEDAGPQSTVVMKRLGLAKEDMFTGTEAEALKNLLRTLRWKTWNPDLYFHIRFFSVRHKLHPMSQETKALVRARWHFILRMLKTLAKIEKILAARSLEKTGDCVTYIDMVEASIKPVCWKNDPNLSFDKHAYKIRAEIMLSIDAQEILTQRLPEKRTADELEQITLSLQYVDDFAKLPALLQQRIAETASYIWVGSNRVILRQGHVPESYYFVLQGQAVSKRFLDDGKTETTGILRKGDGFGSMAILNQCCRRVTVISQTPLHLLVVPKDVILMHFGKDIREISADAVHFLSKIWFMQSWPLKHLVKCPHQCKRRRFRRTEIITVDGAKSEWIYVITQGAFRVFQRLAKPREKPYRRTPLRRDRVTPEASDQCSEHSVVEKKDSWLKKYQYKLVDILRYLDVFGLEDLCLDPKHPPPKRHLLVVSDEVECVMLSKNFYLQMASPQLRRKVHTRLTAQKLTYSQVTSTDCSLIPLGGIQRDPRAVLDPIDPRFCIHC